jgi:hypothetical protein
MRSGFMRGRALQSRGRFITLLAGIGALLLNLSGCSKNGKDTVADPSVSAARFMFVQASPDALPVDLLVDSMRVDSNIAYPNSTHYINFDSGTKKLKIVRPGTMQTIFLALVPVTAPMSYTIFGVDSVAKYYSMLLVDNLSPPGSGKSKLRFVNVSPNAPPVDLVVHGGITLFTNEPFKGKTDFVPLDAGSYSFDVKITGTPTVLASVNNLALQDGKIYTLYIRGFAGRAGITAIDASILIHN